MRLNENVLNLSAYAMEFRVFLHRDRIYPARIQGRILVLTRCFLVFHLYDNMVHFRVSLHNMYYQNYR